MLLRLLAATLLAPTALAQEPAFPRWCAGFEGRPNVVLREVFGGWRPAHQDDVRALAVSADGRFALSAGSRPGLAYWDLASGEPVHVLEELAHEASSAAFAPDGERAATTVAGKLYLWDLVRGVPYARRTFPRALESCAWSAEGGEVLCADEAGVLHAVDAALAEPLYTEELHGEPPSSRWKNELRTRLSAVRDGGVVSMRFDELVLWSTSEQRVTLRRTLHGSGARYLDVSADARFALAVGPRRRGEPVTLELRDLEAGQVLRTVAGLPSNLVGGSLRGDRLAVAWTPDALHVLDLATEPAVVRTVLEGDPGVPLRALALAPDGRSVLTAGLRAGSDPIALAWLDTGTGEPRWSAAGHRAAVCGVALSPDGERVYSCDRDGRLLGWEPGRAAPRWTLALEQPAMSLAAGPRAARLLVGGVQRSWLVAAGTDEPPLALEHGGRLAAFSPDAAEVFVAGVGDPVLQGLDAATGRPTSETRHPDATARFVALTADAGRALARVRPSGEDHWRLSAWSPALAREVWDVRRVDLLPPVPLFSPDGARLLLVGRERTEVLSGETGELEVTIDLGLEDVGDPLALAADGRTALFAREDVVHVIDLERGELGHVALTTASDAARCAAFLPGGEGFVLGTRRGVVLRFDLRRP